MADPERVKPPENLEVLRTQARAFSAAGKWDDVISLRSEILEASPEDVESLNERGRSYRCMRKQHMALGDFQTAITCARTARDQEGELIGVIGLVDAWRTAHRDPEFPYPKGITTEGERKEFGYREAVSYADQARALIAQMPKGFTDAKGHAYNNFGLLFVEVKDYNKALLAYTDAETGIRELLGNNPQDLSLQERLARAVHLKGIALENLGQLTEAEIAQRESLEMSVKLGHVKDTGNAANGLSDVLVKLGRIDEAQSCTKQARNVSEKNGEIIDTEIHADAERRLAEIQLIKTWNSLPEEGQVVARFFVECGDMGFYGMFLEKGAVEEVCQQDGIDPDVGLQVLVDAGLLIKTTLLQLSKDRLASMSEADELYLRMKSEIERDEAAYAKDSEQLQEPIYGLRPDFLAFLKKHSE